MAKIIHGWNDIPIGYVQEEEFHLAPIWLRTLARIKYLEKYAYPIAVKKGLVKRWKIEPNKGAPEFSWSEGIQYINSQYPGFSYGSPIEIQLKKNNFELSRFPIRIISILFILKSVLGSFISSIFSTKWGRNRKTTYIKAKIAESKSMK